MDAAVEEKNQNNFRLDPDLQKVKLSMEPYKFITVLVIDSWTKDESGGTSPRSQPRC